MASYYAFLIFIADDKSVLLIGDISYDHGQIELVCTACHRVPFRGAEVMQEACVDCHAEGLELAQDSHPRSTFTDPRNVDRVKLLDARYCVSCHVEHKPRSENPPETTQPKDFCFQCHGTISDDRPSHTGISFDTCANSGCHNFHDNRSLYEDFLLEHAFDKNTKDIPILPSKNSSHLYQLYNPKLRSLDSTSVDTPIDRNNFSIVREWEMSSHAKIGINCGDCHQPDKHLQWVDKPVETICSNCHKQELSSFTQGKHGMRLSHQLDSKLTPMIPAKSHLKFNQTSQSKELTCLGCHGAHLFDTRKAAIEGCLECHNDSHSKAYKQSPHYELWLKEIEGTLPKNSGVSCATCHLPRLTIMEDGKKRILVEHNQNHNLRPNEKMIRPVCMQCHGLRFSIDALADEGLIERNFIGEASRHIPSIDMALEREAKKARASKDH